MLGDGLYTVPRNEIYKMVVSALINYSLPSNWNDRRSRRVFLCFYSAIFQLTSAKFQTL